ncbi:hypothetical protein MJO47_10355 [Desulfuromonas sp. KJ2020]|uniref:hypothetical protein n=1 Tax=Desulfuromonas sp. KJ2020 TaxID=2919173 RepID=UPI0020A70D70|nr:hypothetical protein [Desulfuromonas sp. KJ2020]MCP3177502.1 hypothetical protein [Desulfuromonas sp. KJ2020]
MKSHILMILAAFFLMFSGPAWSQDHGASAATKGSGTESAKTIKTEAGEELVFVTKGYRYEPADTTEDEDLGHFLCGIRCNALSVDYLNITSPGGWRMLPVAQDTEVVIPLDKMGVYGTCTCEGDEFLVKINNIYMSK